MTYDEAKAITELEGFKVSGVQSFKMSFSYLRVMDGDTIIHAEYGYSQAKIEAQFVRWVEERQ